MTQGTVYTAFRPKAVQVDLVTVFDDILTKRQTREKLQCLYENLMSNNFRRTNGCSDKNISCKLKATKQRIVLKNFGGVPVLKFLQHCTKNLIYIKFTQCKIGAKKCKLRLNKRQRW